MKILYIGNNLLKHTKYPTVLETLSENLRNENIKIIVSSSIKNKVFRLIDMCISVVKNRDVDYILIDTYSTINFYYAFIISQISKVLGIKYIPILHGGNLPYRLSRSPQLSNLIFQSSHVNIAPSNYLKSAFINKGYDCICLPNSINILEYPFLERKSIKPNILWVRSIKELYNPKLAIQILNLIVKIYPSAELCMVGPVYDEIEYNECLELIKEYKLENNVKFTGVLSKKEWHELAKNYDIFLNTTNFDNTPISVIEAMALGLTVVTTNVGGIPYLLEDKKTGFLFEKNNADEAFNIILEIISLNKIKVSKEARMLVENFDWTIVRNDWLKVFKK